jgi:ABC-2 type transport system ATP-binding protein
MNAQDASATALRSHNLRKTFRRKTGATVAALNDVSFDIARGTLTALVGPDGAGKTTFIRLACGLLTPDAGELTVLNIDVASDPQQVQDRIAYMPQRFGLYEDLSVQENLDLYADLHGLTARERGAHYPRLMEMTALSPFVKRLAGQLSGGMKQKLGLACALMHSPEVLLLDEPTAGVDPLSRHELWDIILRLVREEQTTVLISTSYLDEAERCEQAVVLHQGKVLTRGMPRDVSKLADGRVFLASPPHGQPPRWLQARLLDACEVVDAVPEAGRVRLILEEQETLREHAPRDDLLAGLAVSEAPARFEDGFMIMLRRAEGARPSAAMTLDQHIERGSDQTVIEVRDLVRTFGNFTAVDHVSFEVKRGELFGLLGPNGAGKTTTFRMLCGLLPVTNGTLRVAGADLRTARASARHHIGYVAQKFSHYGQLSVIQNLEFFASAYGLRGARKRRRVEWALAQFELELFKSLPSMQLPGGFKQRLAMAAALLHEPDILFLDEPTSGADPHARRVQRGGGTHLPARPPSLLAPSHPRITPP